MKKRGSALAIVLLLISILLPLGIALLFTIEQNYLSATRAESEAEAYYLAMSGVRFYFASKMDLNLSPGIPYTRLISENRAFEIYFDNSGHLHSDGLIYNSNGKLITQRSFILPEGNRRYLYDVP